MGRSKSLVYLFITAGLEILNMSYTYHLVIPPELYWWLTFVFSHELSLMQVGSLCLGNSRSSFTSSPFLSHSPPLVNFLPASLHARQQREPLTSTQCPPPQADYQPAVGMWTPIPEGECFLLSWQCRGQVTHHPDTFSPLGEFLTI